MPVVVAGAVAVDVERVVVVDVVFGVVVAAAVVVVDYAGLDVNYDWDMLFRKLVYRV